MVKGYVILYNTDKKEYIQIPLDIVEVEDAELQDILAGNATIELETYKTEDAYKATRFKKKVATSGTGG